jgi:hypothetical protein
MAQMVISKELEKVLKYASYGFSNVNFKEVNEAISMLYKAKALLEKNNL